jgi:ribosomal protein L40E
MTVTIEEGDGTMQRRLDLGLCPKCRTALDPGPATVCRCCGLHIGGVLDPHGCTPLIDPETVISMTGALR